MWLNNYYTIWYNYWKEFREKFRHLSIILTKANARKYKSAFTTQTFSSYSWYNVERNIKNRDYSNIIMYKIIINK